MADAQTGNTSGEIELDSVEVVVCRELAKRRQLVGPDLRRREIPLELTLLAVEPLQISLRRQLVVFPWRRFGDTLSGSLLWARWSFPQVG